MTMTDLKFTQLANDEDDRIEFEVTIQNVGELDGKTDVTLTVEGEGGVEVVDSIEQIELTPQQSIQVELEYSTLDGGGVKTLCLQTEDDKICRDVEFEIIPPANLELATVYYEGYTVDDVTTGDNITNSADEDPNADLRILDISESYVVLRNSIDIGVGTPSITILNTPTGNEIVEFDNPNDEFVRNRAGAILGDSLIYGTDDGNLYEYDIPGESLNLIDDSLVQINSVDATGTYAIAGEGGGDGSGGGDPDVSVYDLSTGDVVENYTEADNRVSHVAITDDHVAYANSDFSPEVDTGTVFVHERATGDLLYTQNDSEGRILSGLAAGDGVLCVASDGEDYFIREIETGDLLLQDTPIAGDSGMRDIDVADGAVAVVPTLGRVEVIDVSTLELRRLMFQSLDGTGVNVLFATPYEV